MRDIILPRGVYFDHHAHDLRINGRRLTIANAQLSEPWERNWKPVNLRVEAGKGVTWDEVPTDRLQTSPLALHFDVACGENGHCLELTVYPRQRHYGYESMVASGGCEIWPDDGDLNHSAEEVLRLYDMECAKTSEPAEYETPVFGQFWFGFDWLDEDD